MTSHERDNRHIQHELNNYFEHWKVPIAKLDVDGEIGDLTRAAIRTAHLCVGYKEKYASIIADARFMRHIEKPLSTMNATQRARGLAYRRSLRNSPLRLRAWNQMGALVGTHEQGGNNTGPMVDRIIHYAGGSIGEPWCVDTDIYAYGHAGSDVVKPGYPRAVRSMHTSGTQVTENPETGDMVRYKFDHTGLFGYWCNANGQRRPKALATHIRVREGNTGPVGAVSDSGNGRDGVYEKVRSRSLVSDYLKVLR